jgi:hypothetical protein
MKKTVLTILIAGVAMNAYGTDQEGDVKGGYSRLPLSDTSNRQRVGNWISFIPNVVNIFNTE